MTTTDDLMTEAQWQRRVTDYATLRGLRWHHETDSRKSKPGYPDLTIAGPKGVVWLELKTESGRVSTEQRAWIDALRLAGHDAVIARPRHWPDVRALLDALAGDTNEGASA